MGNTKADEYAGFLQTLRIIIGALTAGVLFFLIIVVVFLRAPLQPLERACNCQHDLGCFCPVVYSGQAVCSRLDCERQLPEDRRGNLELARPAI